MHNKKYYITGSIEKLKRCDALYVMEGSENSKGVAKEIEVAKSIGIPVFYEEEEGNAKLTSWLNRPKIMAIVGESGTGKTTAAEFVEDVFDVPMVRSYTDRPPRENDTSHTFLTREEFNKIPREDMIVSTEFGGHRYCCQHKDIQPFNTYVIDERGYMELLLKYKSMYRVEGLRLLRLEEDRIDAVGGARVERDRNKFVLPGTCFDHVYHNDGFLDNFCEWLEEIFNKWRHE